MMNNKKIPLDSACLGYHIEAIEAVLMDLKEEIFYLQDFIEQLNATEKKKNGKKEED